MRIVRGRKVKYIPASHESPDNPSVLKKVLFTYKDFLSGGRIQMINWAKLKRNSGFILHFHEDMQEVFILLCGKAKFIQGKQICYVYKGDAIVVEVGNPHKMVNIGKNDLYYLVVGISKGEGGKTIIIKDKKE